MNQPGDDMAEIPDFSGDDFAHDKEIQRARQEAKEQQELFDNSISNIQTELAVEEYSHVNLKGFTMFKNLQAILITSYQSIANKSDLVISVAEYSSSFPIPRNPNSGTDWYLFGRLKLRNRFPKTYICKESIRETIMDLFLKTEVNFPEHKKFCKKFYVLTEDKNRIITLMRDKNLNELAQFPNMELEFVDDFCLYRNSRKAISPAEATQFVQLTRTLSKIIS